MTARRNGTGRVMMIAGHIGRPSRVERREKPAAGRAPTEPKPPSKAALRRRLREAEAKTNALRVQLAQIDEVAGTRRPSAGSRPRCRQGADPVWTRGRSFALLPAAMFIQQVVPWAVNLAQLRLTTPSVPRTPRPSQNPMTRETMTSSGHPEVSGQRQGAGRAVGATAPTVPSMGFLPPSVYQAQCPQTHGGGQECSSKRVCAGQRPGSRVGEPGCKPSAWCRRLFGAVHWQRHRYGRPLGCRAGRGIKRLETVSRA